MQRQSLPRPAAISNDEYHARRVRLMAALPANAAVLLPAGTLKPRNHDGDYPFRQDSDFHYLTGFPEPDALLLLLPGREARETVLFCQPKDPLAEAWTGIRIGATGAVERFGIAEAHGNEARDELLLQLLDGRETLYFALDNEAMLTLARQVCATLTARVRRGAKPPRAFADIRAHLHEQRLIKSEAELALMRHAAHISARAHCRAMQCASPGLYEYQLQAEIEHEFAWHGARFPAYGTIVGSGSNACVLHYVENGDRLDDGDLVLIDAGGEFDFYAGDITRTFPVNGRFSMAQRQLYQLVLDAQKRAVAAVRPGNTLVAIHDGVVHDLTEGLIRLGLLAGDVQARIDDDSYRRFYLHSTSHWLGLDTHDVGAYKVDGTPRPLEPGMVVTIEPGLYIPDSADIPAEFRGIGIRIEDDVIVTNGGGDVTTGDVPKEIDAIEALMASEER